MKNFGHITEQYSPYRLLDDYDAASPLEMKESPLLSNKNKNMSRNNAIKHSLTDQCMNQAELDSEIHIKQKLASKISKPLPYGGSFLNKDDIKYELIDHD